jgi:hypothetical protein
MTVNYNDTVRTNRLNVVNDAISSKTFVAGSGAGSVGSLVIGTVDLPTGAGVLVTIPLQNPAGTISGPLLTISGVPLGATASATGTAALAEIRNNAGQVVVRGLTVGTAAADIILTTVAITSGQTVQLTAGTIRHSGVGAPDAFTAGMWTVDNAFTGGEAVFDLLSLPYDGGSPPSRLQYKIGAGSWTDFVGVGTGPRTVPGFTDTVSTATLVRMVNAVTAGADSDSKNVTTTAVAGADYIINNGTDWTNTMALGSATLAGKVAEVRGALGAVDINGIAPASAFTIRGGAGGSIRNLEFLGTCNRITLEDMPFQMTGWPRTETEMVMFNTGSFDNLTFTGCSWRHGYGAGLIDFDMTASYPEYNRVDNVTTATATASRIALTWQDPAMTTGWIEFFNRGASTVHYAAGDSGVTATLASPSVAAGGYVRVYAGPSNTHISVITPSGTSQINARTEIGVSNYLANCFAAFGSASIGRLEIRGCTFRDVNNGIKGIGRPSLAIIMDNDMDRIYQDIMAVPPATGGAAYIFRNLVTVPFSRSGVAEGLLGDPQDPHGDTYQSFGTGSGTIGPIYVGGNRTRRTGRRPGTLHQGVFFSDNNINPSYDGIYIVSEHLIAGNANGISSGEAGYPLGDMMVWGTVVVDGGDISGGASTIRLETVSDGRVYVGRSITQGYVGYAGGLTVDESILVSDATSAAALFPNSANITTAVTRAEIETAWATADVGTGLGMAATADAIDWTTADHTAVILWQNIASGVAWEDANNQAINTLITLPLSKVKNRRVNQTVVPGSGVEWRSTASDGVTQVQAWTTSSGTVQPDEYVQIRKLSSTLGLTSVNFDITINGFLSRAALTTQAVVPTLYHTQTGSGPYFRDPANSVPANTTRLEFAANIYPTSFAAATTRLFTQESVSCDLEFLGSGGMRLNVKNGAGTAVLTNVVSSTTYDLNQWQTFVLDVDQVAGTASLSKNGVNVGSWTWTPSGSAFFRTAKEISFLGTTTGGNKAPSGWQVEYCECYFTTGGVRSLRSPRVEGNAATINIPHPWKLGTDAT